VKEVAVGIILKGGHVLTCQRKRDAKYPLKWEFPGGKLEEGELPEHALRRELREELAIHASVEREFFRKEWTYSDNGSFRVMYYIIRDFSGELQNHAFEQILWVRPHELHAMDNLEGNCEAIERLVKYVEEETA
jgi:8-oxo-dGTP diphosphatase